MIHVGPFEHRDIAGRALELGGVDHHHRAGLFHVDEQGQPHGAAVEGADAERGGARVASDRFGDADPHLLVGEQCISEAEDEGLACVRGHG